MCFIRGSNCALLVSSGDDDLEFLPLQNRAISVDMLLYMRYSGPHVKSKIASLVGKNPSSMGSALLSQFKSLHNSGMTSLIFNLLTICTLATSKMNSINPRFAPRLKNSNTDERRSLHASSGLDTSRVANIAISHL